MNENSLTLTEKVYFDRVTGRSYNRRTHIKDGKTLNTEYFVRFYNYNELEALLRTQA